MIYLYYILAPVFIVLALILYVIGHDDIILTRVITLGTCQHHCKSNKARDE